MNRCTACGGELNTGYVCVDCGTHCHPSPQPQYVQFGTAKAMQEEIVSLKAQLERAEARVEGTKMRKGTNITRMHMQKHPDGVYLKALDLELFLRKELQDITKLQPDSDLTRYLTWLVEQPMVWAKDTVVSERR